MPDLLYIETEFTNPYLWQMQSALQRWSINEGLNAMLFAEITAPTVTQWALFDEIKHLKTFGKPSSPDGELAHQFYRKIEWADMTDKPFIVSMEPLAEATTRSWDYLDASQWRSTSWKGIARRWVGRCSS